MVRVMKDGRTYRQHLEAAAKHIGPGSDEARRELAGPELPDAWIYLWDWFCELHAARSYHSAGGNPIGFAEIAAWAALTRRSPSAWEVDQVRALDLAWLSGGKDEDASGDRRPA